MKKLLTTLFLLAIAFCYAQSDTKSESKLKPYYLVMLKKGAHRDQDSATAANIQKAHLEYIGKMAESGKLNIAGPFLDDGPLRGIFIFDSGNEEEVRKMVMQDPAVKAGRLDFEIHPWMTQQGSCFK